MSEFSEVARKRPANVSTSYDSNPHMYFSFEMFYSICKIKRALKREFLSGLIWLHLPFSRPSASLAPRIVRHATHDALPASESYDPGRLVRAPQDRACKRAWEAGSARTTPLSHSTSRRRRSDQVPPLRCKATRRGRLAVLPVLQRARARPPAIPHDPRALLRRRRLM